MSLIDVVAGVEAGPSEDEHSKRLFSTISGAINELNGFSYDSYKQKYFTKEEVLKLKDSTPKELVPANVWKDFIGLTRGIKTGPEAVVGSLWVFSYSVGTMEKQRIGVVYSPNFHHTLMAAPLPKIPTGIPFIGSFNPLQKQEYLAAYLKHSYLQTRFTRVQASNTLAATIEIGIITASRFAVEAANSRDTVSIHKPIATIDEDAMLDDSNALEETDKNVEIRYVDKSDWDRSSGTKRTRQSLMKIAPGTSPLTGPAVHGSSEEAHVTIMEQEKEAEIHGLMRPIRLAQQFHSLMSSMYSDGSGTTAPTTTTTNPLQTGFRMEETQGTTEDDQMTD